MRESPQDHGLIMERVALQRDLSTQPFWVFGYGSIVWKVGFEYEEARVCYAKDWRRRFFQGSTDHRGTVECPGRTVTLEHAPGEKVWGVAYRVHARHEASVLELLEVREKQYNLRIELDLFDDSTDGDSGQCPIIRNALTYIATECATNRNWLGPADAQEIAERIAIAHGPSGPNFEYLFQLVQAMRSYNIHDAYLEDLEARVKKLLLVESQQPQV
ncbi:Gamma-glutamylcyclotransferase 2-3 [Porphyridium purpureum]|uniref:glutathione-specific gamma-glutamylcyclotransferase n=1 Tax=Porphyridium purpureum TaxID=35688 RepID=A0A5J4Z175_PORPP|nr:Gamma-glutamylcyclotransferase 2-3 [Porphyridium purpureum]|eukprot:POR6524..scf208_2